MERFNVAAEEEYVTGKLTIISPITDLSRQKIQATFQVQEWTANNTLASFQQFSDMTWAWLPTVKEHLVTKIQVCLMPMIRREAT